MGITLDKGRSVSLLSEAPGLKSIELGLGWDAGVTDTEEFDLDASLFMLSHDGRVRSDRDLVYYGNLVSDCGSIEHAGDNLTGEGDGDDEAVTVRLEKVPSDIHRLVIAVTIHEAENTYQSFGEIENAFIRVVNLDNDIELVRFDLTEDYSIDTALIFGEVYKDQSDWKFRAIGKGFSGGLKFLCDRYGIAVMD